MSDQEPRLTPPPAPHEVVTDRTETVRVRRSPKYAVFLLAGAILGVITAFILTVAFGTPGTVSDAGMVYSQPQVFGFLLLFCIPAWLAIAGIVALILDRTVGRRTREVIVDRETVRQVD